MPSYSTWSCGNGASISNDATCHSVLSGSHSELACADVRKIIHEAQYIEVDVMP